MVSNKREQVDPFPRNLPETPAVSGPGVRHGIHIEAEDGTKLALDVLLPRDATETTKYPTALNMTRYWRGTVGLPLDFWQTFFTEREFAVVVGDGRGTGASFGQWKYHRNRKETYDFTAIMDWIIAQPWSDGTIIGYGNSYKANTADWMAERNHPALKAIVPRYADYDPYADLYFPGGVPNSFMGESWGTYAKNLDLNIRRDKEGRLLLGVRPVDGSEGKHLLQQAIEEHRPVPSVWEGIQQITYRDDRPDTWDGTSMTDFGICSHADELVRSGVPIQNWAGWMDTETASGAIHRFLALDESVHVIIGPWSHGSRHCFDPLHPERDEIVPTLRSQQEENLAFIREAIAGKWARKQKRLSYYTCGIGRWTTTTIWPPTSTRYENWYFGSDSSLSRSTADSGADSYKVDFHIGTGNSTRWGTNFDSRAVYYEDRRDIDKRLLCYTSLPLERDIEITGHPILTLFLTSTEEDGAIFAYLELVDPDGKVIYLTEGQFRVIHRKISNEEPIYPFVGPHHSFLRKDAMPLIPGEVAEVTFELNPFSVHVPAGHCLRIAIAGADKDVFARIPAKGDPTLEIHRSADRPSRITLPIIPVLG